MIVVFDRILLLIIYISYTSGQKTLNIVYDKLLKNRQ